MEQTKAMNIVTDLLDSFEIKGTQGFNKQWLLTFRKFPEDVVSSAYHEIFALFSYKRAPSLGKIEAILRGHKATLHPSDGIRHVDDIGPISDEEREITHKLLMFLKEQFPEGMFRQAGFSKYKYFLATADFYKSVNRPRLQEYFEMKANEVA